MPEYIKVTPLPAVPGIDALTYKVPQPLKDRLVVGARVVVPLGRRRVTALAIGAETEAPADVRCRDVLSILDEEVIVPPSLIELARWMADYYIAGIGDVLSLAIGRSLTTASRRYAAVADATLARTPGERSIIAELEAANGPVAVDTLARRTGVRSSDRIVAVLAERGALTLTEALATPRAGARFTTVARIVRVPDEAASLALFRRAPSEGRSSTTWPSSPSAVPPWPI